MYKYIYIYIRTYIYIYIYVYAYVYLLHTQVEKLYSVGKSLQFGSSWYSEQATVHT